MKHLNYLKQLAFAAIAACSLLLMSPVNVQAETTEEVFITDDGDLIPSGVMGSSFAIEAELYGDAPQADPFSINLADGLKQTANQPIAAVKAYQINGDTTGSPFTTDTYSHEPQFAGHQLVHGVDVSKWQATNDWAAMKAAGVDFAFVRVGYRSVKNGALGVDERYVENLTNAVANGINVGAYIYSQAISVEEAEEEAEFIISLVEGFDVTLPLVIDYENGYYTSNNKSVDGRLVKAYKDGTVNKDKATEIIQAFCRKVEAAGYTPMLYANTDFLQTKLNGTVIGNQYPVWQARYDVTTHPSTSKLYYPGNYSFWQYTAKGKVNGSGSNNTDCDFWYLNTNVPASKPMVVSQTKDSITLTWADVPTASRYLVFRLDPVSNTYNLLGTVANRVFVDTGLAPGGTYTYCILAAWTNIGNETLYSLVSETTDAVTLPDRANDFAVAGRTDSSLTYAWTPVYGASGYRMFSFDPASAAYALLGDTTENTFTVSNLPSASPYFVLMCPYIVFDNQIYWGEFTDLIGTVTSPAPTGELTLLATTADAAAFSWNPVACDGYEILRFDGVTQSFVTVDIIADPLTAAYADTTLSPANTYYYTVRAIKTFGNETFYSDYAPVLERTTEPLAVTGLISQKVSATSAALAWDVSQNAAGYEIFLFDPTVGDFRYYAEALGMNTNTALVENLPSGCINYFVVRAFTLNGTTRNYGTFSDVTAVINPPRDVASVTVKKADSSSITLTWSACENANGYYVFRKDNTTGEYALLAATDGSQLTYTDTALKAATKYTYTVLAYTMINGEQYISDGFADFTLTTATNAVTSLTASATSDSSITLKWSKVTGANGYLIYRLDTATKKYVQVATITKGSTVKYVDTDLKAGTTYSYKVYAYRNAGTQQIKSKASAVVRQTTKPAQVTGLKAASRKTSSIKLSWNKVTGASGYDIYRYNPSTKKYVKVGSVTKGSTTTFTDTKLKGKTTYKYKVVAYRNYNGKKVTGSYSKILSAKTK